MSTPASTAPARKAPSIASSSSVDAASPRATAMPNSVVVPVRCVTDWCWKPRKPTAFTMPATQASAPAPTHTHRGSATPIEALQDFRGVVRQARTLAAAQRDVRAVRPVLEAVHRVGQAGGRFRQVRRIDLLDVAHADDLRAGARARDQ